jgi:hypothetical protein
MSQKLYVERWLLLLKEHAVQSGLDAQVRALDRKGGKWLALALSQGSERVEFRYYKRVAGAAMAAAATGAASAARARAVHRQVLDGHRGLLENGLRRFLSRSMRLLETLERAFRDDVDLPRRLEAALAQIEPTLREQRLEARPAAAARKPKRFAPMEILPAACLHGAGRQHIFAVRDGQLVDLAALVPLRRQPKDQPGEKESFTWWTLQQVADPGAGALVEGGLELVTSSGGAEALQAGATALGNLAQVGASAVEVAAESSACADASLGGLDCGAIDCAPG